MCNHWIDSDSHCPSWCSPKKAACKCNGAKKAQRYNDRTAGPEPTSPTCRRRTWRPHAHIVTSKLAKARHDVVLSSRRVQHSSNSTHGSWQQQCLKGGAGAQTRRARRMQRTVINCLIALGGNNHEAASTLAVDRRNVVPFNNTSTDAEQYGSTKCLSNGS